MRTELDIIAERQFAVEQAEARGEARGEAKGEAKGEARGRKLERADLIKKLQQLEVSPEVINQLKHPGEED